jgi:N-acetylmuramoyl-L-alanine amidase
MTNPQDNAMTFLEPSSITRRLCAGVAALAAAVLSGCATVATEGGVPIDATHKAQGQDSRVLFLVLHYTVADFPTSMKILTEQQVSSHYLLSDETEPRIYRLVDENRRAWHSGASAWKENRRLNSSSIGIEIVHPGIKRGTPDIAAELRQYEPWTQKQFEVLVPLIKDIVKRHQILPERILGHGEVSAQYKEDPGPTFPWKQLADLGITPPWPDAMRVAGQRALYESTQADGTPALPDALWFQKTLARHGYEIQPTGVWDKQTQRVLMNFQMRYRPADYLGRPDAETAALLWVLTNPVKPAPVAAAAPVPAQATR